MKTTNQLITDILNREGPEYTNKPGDRGGPTKYGITLATLAAYRGRPVTAADVQALTEIEARNIYDCNFIIKPGYNKLTNVALIEQMIDAGVQHGIKEAIELLQHALKLPADGVMGPKTIAAANAAPQIQLVIYFIACRLKFYGDILGNEVEWEFSGGWFHRMAQMLAIYGSQVSGS